MKHFNLNINGLLQGSFVTSCFSFKHQLGVVTLIFSQGAEAGVVFDPETFEEERTNL